MDKSSNENELYYFTGAPNCSANKNRGLTAFPFTIPVFSVYYLFRFWISLGCKLAVRMCMSYDPYHNFLGKQTNYKWKCFLCKKSFFSLSFYVSFTLISLVGGTVHFQVSSKSPKEMTFYFAFPSHCSVLWTRSMTAWFLKRFFLKNNFKFCNALTI